jgi:putative solute:sodium symporter small subunit
MQVPEIRRRYWRKNVGLIGVLLAIGFVVTFLVAYFARELNFTFFGWPFSFWVGAQGALIVYLVLIAFYAKTMNRLDLEHEVEEVD